MAYLAGYGSKALEYSLWLGCWSYNGVQSGLLLGIDVVTMGACAEQPCVALHIEHSLNETMLH